MNRARPALLACVCTALLQASAIGHAQAPANPSLGRLFMTPDTRVQLERQRQLNLQEARSMEAGAIRLDGIVARSGGKSTVWVNNQPVTENDSTSGISATPTRQHPGEARLITGSDAPADLKVGVTLDRATRETAGGLAAGEIRVRPGR